MGTSHRFLKVLDYMEENLQETMSLQTLSDIAGYSVPQFYRLFKQLTGDTVAEYVLRRRMAEAAMEVKRKSKSIAEIAYSYGFQSHDVFTRSFRRVYGMTPIQYQNSSSELQPLKCFEILKQELAGEQVSSDKQEDTRQMTFSIIEKQPFRVVGLECKARTWDSDGAIGELWCGFLERESEIIGKAEPVIMYGICEEETCQETQFVYMAAVQVNQIETIPDGMKVRSYPAQKYLKAQVPQKITTPDAYTCARAYAKSLGFILEAKDELELYEDNFKDPDNNQFALLIPIR